MIYLLAFITLAATVTQFVAFKRMLAYVQRELMFKPGAYLPKVSIILPCKGLDPDFSTNIRKLLRQEYFDAATGKPNFEVIFAVGSANDPAYAPLKEQCDLSGDVPTKLIVANANPSRAHKVNNQLAALEHVSADTEVLVFVDADVIARGDFIRYLVAQLDDPAIGATTGYRFYIPFKGDWPSLIRSLWNRMSAWELANPQYAFAWGGAMAAKRDVFERAKVRENWERAADDDLVLCTSIKKLGLRIHFVPQCLVASHGDATLKEIFEWTNRQLILTKIYYPELWRRAMQKAVVLTVWLLAIVTAAFYTTILHDSQMLFATLAGLSLIPVELAFLIRAQGMWSRVLHANLASSTAATDVKVTDRQSFADPEEQYLLQTAYNKSLWRFSAILPLAHLVLPWMTLYSVVTNRITWRGITYELRSPTETVII
ncbi:MAG TPA: glycosyltransferase family 2 protein [Planktothrix sp.]|jgi:cellulose synthase/poly-beta-1,6-N-acetylglucosamine synthase-like glycosyltransferase